jgi:hypothetical protein
VVDVLAVQFRLVRVPLVVLPESVEFATIVAEIYGLEDGTLIVLIIPAVVIGIGAVYESPEPVFQETKVGSHRESEALTQSVEELGCLEYVTGSTPPRVPATPFAVPSPKAAAKGKRLALLLPFHHADPYSVASAVAMSASMRVATTPSSAGMRSVTVIDATWSLNTSLVTFSTTVVTKDESAGNEAFWHSR